MSADSKKRQEAFEQVQRLLIKRVKEGALDESAIQNISSYAASPKKYKLQHMEELAVPRLQVETKRLVLCFDYLNERTCIYDQFDSTKSRALINLFAKVTSCEVSAFPSSGIVRDTIRNTSPYTSLFGGKLTPDVTTLQETELPDGGRVFFFITENKFNIVSIESRHRNLNQT